ncbi:hypothetical protein CPB84DRAFT_764137 [Gymnopilus junonius]|uniref:Uncharacterized protein n=1 Tax=Gymnopilus junonius TaxID=109634 RepID=A0A9P5NXX9_GYMJU|nr:hypothetical protein CPB84DRAFT_764137 [Gymnopilus junonius]
MCPNLLFLELDIIFRRHDSVFFDDDDFRSLPPLPSTSIPLLKSFRGSRPAIKMFVPRRPVESVCFDQAYWPECVDIFSDISRSTRSVDTLIYAGSGVQPSVLKNMYKTLTGLRKLRLELPKYGSTIPDQDPRSSNPGTVVGKRAQKINEFPSSGFLYPHSVHILYLTYLYCIALGKVNLPEGLEILELKTDMHLDRPELDSNERHDVVNSDKEIISRYGQPYTHEMACSILDSISILYPKMKHIQIINQDRTSRWTVTRYHFYALKWARDERSNWTYTDLKEECSRSEDDYKFDSIA